MNSPMPEAHLDLTVTASQLETFCEQLLARSRDVVKTHEALITLETFIKVFAAGQQGSEGYTAVEALISRYTEQTRQQLLQQKSVELLRALQGRNIQAVAAVHTPLSRNGFYLMLQALVADLSSADIQQLHAWAAGWTVNAKQNADQHSAYPDAPDFRAAGIVLEEYLAMVDVERYLQSCIRP